MMTGQLTRAEERIMMCMHNDLSASAYLLRWKSLTSTGVQKDDSQSPNVDPFDQSLSQSRNPPYLVALKAPVSVVDRS